MTAKKCKTNITASQKEITDTKVSKCRQNDTKWPKWNQKQNIKKKKKTCKETEQKSKNDQNATLCYMPYALGDLTTWQWTKTTLYKTLKENKTATQDAQQHRKIQQFMCVAAIAVCLAQKSRLIIWTIIILGLIVWGWKIWPHNCLHVAHRPSAGLVWPNPWRQRDNA